MRLHAFCLGLVLAVLTPFAAFAQTFETPEAMLEALYAPYLRDESVSDYTPFFSDHLNGLYQTDSEKAGGEVGAIGFDAIIAGQDYKITEFGIGETEIDGDTAEIIVTFNNFDEPQTLRYSLVRENDSWKVDDIESRTPDFEWQLSQIFADAVY
jgi:hypothetical protein